jgi:hypothetical protein
LNRDQSRRQIFLFSLLQVPYQLAKELDPAGATSDKHFLALGSRSDPNDSTIARVLCFDDEFLLLQGVYDSSHGWRLNLFGLSQLAQSDCAIEDNHGKS